MAPASPNFFVHGRGLTASTTRKGSDPYTGGPCDSFSTYACAHISIFRVDRRPPAAVTGNAPSVKLEMSVEASRSLGILVKRRSRSTRKRRLRAANALRGGGMGMGEPTHRQTCCRLRLVHNPSHAQSKKVQWQRKEKDNRVNAKIKVFQPRKKMQQLHN